MSAYFIAELVEVTDPASLERYQAEVPSIIARHGGQYVAAGTPETVEGDWNPALLVVVAFENMDRLKGWYGSEEYAPYRRLRHHSATSNLLFINGL